MIAAIVLSNNPVFKTGGASFAIVYHCSKFFEMSELHAQRIQSIQNLDENLHPWFFWLDDDDDLPVNIDSVLKQCLDCASANDVDIVCTNELVFESGKPEKLNRHTHHLVLRNTKAAKRDSLLLERGVFHTETLLDGIAKLTNKATYLDVVGYHWNKKTTGMHANKRAVESIARSKIWLQDRFGAHSPQEK